ncbi:hypothetical protein X989_5853 [Burkholderia pseudomallei MSHR4378]|nr:hypothetical protein X989_5853 [Burkholderia pseudomallei MSHR4378]
MRDEPSVRVTAGPVRMGRAIGSVPIMLQKSPPFDRRRAFRMGGAARVFFAFERGMRS